MHNYLQMFTMPLDVTSVLMAVVMLILTFLTVHLVLILAAYLVWPITIAVFVLVSRAQVAAIYFGCLVG